MAINQTFVDFVTPVPADWLNNTNNVVNYETVINVAGLRALNVVQGGSIVVAGTTTAGDGGGGTYVYDPTDTTSSDNGVTIIVDALNRRWHLIGTGTNSLFVTPEQFGAVPDWNGTTGTDNTAAWGRMNTYLTGVGRGYIIMSGRYYLPGGWTLPCGNLIVDGVGSGELHTLGTGVQGISGLNISNVIVRNLYSTIPLTNYRTGFQINTLFASGSNILIDNLRTQGGVAGIWFQTCNKVTVRNCYVDTPKADGIHFAAGSYDCIAIGNTVYNCADDAYACTWDGVSRPYNITFANNTLDGSIAGYGFAIYSGDNVVISGNNARNVGYGLILITNDPTAGSTPCTNVTASGNKVNGCCQAEVIPYNYWDGGTNQPVYTIYGMYLSGTSVHAKGNVISGVTSLPNGLPSSGCILSGATYGDVTGNTFDSVNGFGVTTGNGNAQISICNNTFENNVNAAIYSPGTVSVSMIIANNTMGFGATTGNPYMVWVQNAGTTRTMICNNTDASGRGIQLDGTSTNVVSTNNNF